MVGMAFLASSMAPHHILSIMEWGEGWQDQHWELWVVLLLDMPWGTTVIMGTITTDTATVPPDGAAGTSATVGSSMATITTTITTGAPHDCSKLWKKKQRSFRDRRLNFLIAGGHIMSSIGTTIITTANIRTNIVGQHRKCGSLRLNWMLSHPDEEAAGDTKADGDAQFSSIKIAQQQPKCNLAGAPLNR